MSDTSTIDWNAIKQRLAESDWSQDEQSDVNSERLRDVFRRRAERLATRRIDSVKTVETSQAMTFSLGNESYGILLNDVQQVLPYTNCTPLPTAGPELLGIMSIRGEILTVIDLAVLLSLTRPRDEERGYVVVVNSGNTVVALRVDRLERVIEFNPADLVAVGISSSGQGHNRIRGMTPDGITILDTQSLIRFST